MILNHLMCCPFVMGGNFYIGKQLAKCHFLVSGCIAHRLWPFEDKITPYVEAFKCAILLYQTTNVATVINGITIELVQQLITSIL